MRRGCKIVVMGLTLAASALMFTGCGSDETDDNAGNGGRTVEIVKDAIGSLPNVPAVARLQASNGRASVSPLATPAYTSFSNYFNLECWYDDLDYCPAGLVKNNSNRLTMGTLLGAIHHAQMTSMVFSECSGNGLTPKTITAASFKPKTAGGNATKFMIGDMWSQYTCHNTNVGAPEEEIWMHSADPSGTYQSTIHSAYHSDGTQFFQVYIGLNADGKPQFLAFNSAGYSDQRQDRTILLVNLATHRFALKWYKSDDNYIVATGVGGLDVLTGARHAGYFWLKVKDNGVAENNYCINNGDNQIVANGSCTGATPAVPVNWASSDAIKSYLEITTADEARILPFLAKFANATQITPSNDVAQLGEMQLYFPATLE